MENSNKYLQTLLEAQGERAAVRKKECIHNSCESVTVHSSCESVTVEVHVKVHVKV